MPKPWYIAATIVAVAWCAFIFWCAQTLPWDPALVGFIGTVLTLFPTGLDSLRKFYLATHRPAPPPAQDQQQTAARFEALIGQAFQGFNQFYALCFGLGLSGIAFAFARQYLSGQG